MGVKIVPVADTTIKKECTILLVVMIVKGAQQDNGVLKLVLKRNLSVSIASLGHMVTLLKGPMRNHPASNATKEDFQ
mgnify:CR=1 FL=1